MQRDALISMIIARYSPSQSCDAQGCYASGPFEAPTTLRSEMPSADALD
jgi:hypothetical protein